MFKERFFQVCQDSRRESRCNTSNHLNLELANYLANCTIEIITALQTMSYTSVIESEEEMQQMKKLTVQNQGSQM